MDSNLIAMASIIIAMTSNPIVMAFNLIVMASNQITSDGLIGARFFFDEMSRHISLAFSTNSHSRALRLGLELANLFLLVYGLTRHQVDCDYDLW